MAKCLVLSVLAAGLAATAGASPDRWVSGGPFGGDVHFLVADPGAAAVLYAGTESSGVFKSTDGAASWTPANRGMGAQRINDLILVEGSDPDSATLFAATDGGLFRTRSGAARWSRSSSGLPEEIAVFSLAADSADAAIVYLGTDAGVFKSTNGGGRWRLADALDGAIVTALAVDPETPSNIYAGTNRGAFKSTDAGASWAPARDGLSSNLIDQLLIDPARPETLYAVSLGNTASLYKSTDGAVSWAQFSFAGSGFARSLALDPSNPSTLFAATGSNRNVYKSTDGGDTWSDGSEGIRSLIILSVAVDPADSSVVYAGTDLDGGVYKSTDGGVTFAAANGGLAGVDLNALALHPEDPTVLFGGTEEAIVRSTDGGASWETLETGIVGATAEAFAIDPSNPDTIYAGGGRAFGSGILKSTDGGDTWELAANALTVPGSVSALVIDPQSPQTVYAATGGGLLKSSDGGETWDDISASLPETSMFDLALDPRQPQTLYASTAVGFFAGKVLRSRDGGATWESADAGLPEDFFLSLAVDPRDSTLYAAGLFNGVYKSTDSGDTWTETAATFGGLFVTADPTLTDTVYASTLLGVLQSRDGGDHWYPLGDDLPVPASALVIDPTKPETFHAGTFGRSAFRLEREFGCAAGEETLCIDDTAGDARFSVSLSYDTEQGGTNGTGLAGEARVAPLESLGISRGGVLSFTDPSNPEVLVKVLDGCAINGHYWVFSAATTNVGYDLFVTDNVAEVQKIYRNDDLSTAATETDTRAFATCDAASAGAATPVGATVAASPVTAQNAPPVFAISKEDRRASLVRAWKAAGEGQPTRRALHEALREELPSWVVPQRPRAAEARVATTARTFDPVSLVEALGTCEPGATSLCVDDVAGDGRFRVTASFETVLGGGQSGDAKPAALEPLGITRGGVFSFTDPANPEVLVKVLNGCAINGHYWVFAAATTTVGFELVVEDTEGGMQRTFVNPDENTAEPILETAAFATCAP